MTEKICRLCLQTINENYQAIRESLLKTLKLNVNISVENVMCIECANYLQVFYNFTQACVYGKDRILLLTQNENVVNKNPVDIETTSNLKLETEIKCSVCTKTSGRVDLVLLNASRNHELVNIVMQYIPEMNLNNTEALLTCKTCIDALRGVSNFILSCVEVEDRIIKYTEMEGTDSNGQIELSNVQQFMFTRPTIKYEIEPASENKFNEEKYTMAAVMEIKCEKDTINPDVIIKPEYINFKSEQGDCISVQQLLVENTITDERLETSSQTTHKKCNKQRILIPEKPSEIKIFKCDLCSFETKWKVGLKRHILTHKSPLEITMFKCQMCLYETKRKETLKQHVLIHKKPSEIDIFQCEMCSFNAIRKCYLKRHLLTHKSSSEVNMFKCEMCSYETKYKHGLLLHLLTHKSRKEINMFKCDICSFETKCKIGLKKHLLTHKSPSEVTMFKCQMCAYETKRKGSLKQHIMMHKSPLEMNMFKCEKCSYESKRKETLKQHLLTHKDPSEIIMFKCALCAFNTKHKGYLKRHLLTHKSSSEINMLKCELCSFETTQKEYLKRHSWIHKNPSEIIMFKCETCSFVTKRKHYLKRHLLTHERDKYVSVQNVSI